MSMQVMDHARGYGVVSRFFHWSMAALILWQAISAALHFLVDDTPLADFFSPGISHSGCCCWCWSRCARSGG
ncbi:MAG: hypothetical protein R8G60_02440 [Roseovarius pacificus]|nr:hypothetical protein [Roseovarius pacificus]